MVLVLAMMATDTEAAKTRGPASHHSGVVPLKNGDCPIEYPIKGNFTTHSGERCIYHMPGQRFYAKTKAERYYASESEAVKDGCRRSKP